MRVTVAVNSESTRTRGALALAAIVAAGAVFADPMLPVQRPGSPRMTHGTKILTPSVATVTRALSGFAFGLIAVRAWLRSGSRRPQLLTAALRPLLAPPSCVPALRPALVHSFSRGGRLGP